MVRPDPAADEIDQRRQVAAAARLWFIGRQAQGTTNTVRKVIAAVTSVEEGEPFCSSQRGNLLARKRRERRAAHQEGEPFSRTPPSWHASRADLPHKGGGVAGGTDVPAF